MDKLPSKKEMMDAIIKILQDNGGGMKTADINDAVANYLDIPEDLLLLEDANCTGTEYSYRMRWARTELKQKGIIQNVTRGVWALSDSDCQE